MLFFHAGWYPTCQEAERNLPAGLTVVKVDFDDCDDLRPGLSMPAARCDACSGPWFVPVGIGVLLGWDRAVQTWLVEHSPIRPWELDSGFIPQS